MSSKNIIWFEEIDKHDIPEAGGKGANLGELTQAGIPVPPGFVVTAGAYFEFLKKNRIDRKIKQSLSGLNPEKAKELNRGAKEIQTAILHGKMDSKLSEEIIKSYTNLYTHKKQSTFVAVRSSATAEDLPTASFAGQQATFLNISGGEQVVKAVRQCWASLFEPRAIYYRIVNKFEHLKVGIAVPVQAMVQSEKAGVLFTIDPVNNDKDVVVIDAAYGLGEAVVSGSVTPDRYYVEKTPLKILDKNISKQTWKITKAKNKIGDIHADVKPDEQKKQKLTDKEILELAKIGLKIEKHYGSPQDTEWSIDNQGRIYFVQSRPVTTLTKKVPLTEVEGKKTDLGNKSKPILKGAGASVGVKSGLVKIIHGPAEIDKIKEGDVLVTEMTNPSYVPAMKRSAAIITDTGGVTSHAAIVSRELGIPCVVGAGTATHDLKNGMVVTVDGAGGLVYKGKINQSETINQPQTEISTKEKLQYREEIPVTATKVYVNLAEPEMAENMAKLPVDGVGLMRAEFIVAGTGVHPKELVKEKPQKYINILAEGMRKICEAFSPRPVVYRATDFKTNEYKALKGGNKFESDEENPMIGYRGCFRYIKEPEMFGYELEAIKLVRDKYDLKNLWLMLPFVRTVDELKKCKELIENAGLVRSRNFKLWMMAEIPSNVIIIDKFLEAGIDGISIGSNDLTQLTLGVDRDSRILAEEFDERNEAVIRSIKMLTSACRAEHVTISCCGQAPSIYPDFTEKLVEMGITSVSVNPDKIIDTRRLIASIEKKILLNKKIK